MILYLLATSLKEVLVLLLALFSGFPLPLPLHGLQIPLVQHRHGRHRDGEPVNR